MAEIRNYTLNFGSGRPTKSALTRRSGGLACAEVQLRRRLAGVAPSIGVAG
jgi:hypothetical protein